jgi:hypothetical protein
MVEKLYHNKIFFAKKNIKIFENAEYPAGLRTNLLRPRGGIFGE